MNASELDDAIRAVNLRYTNNLYVFDVERAIFLAGMRLAADIAERETSYDAYNRVDAHDAIRRAADELESP